MAKKPRFPKTFWLHLKDVTKFLANHISEYVKKYPN